MFNTIYNGIVYLYPPNRATIIKGMKRKSKIKPISNLIGKAMHNTIEMDVRRIRIFLLYVCSLFSKKIKNSKTGKSKNRKFNSKDSIKTNPLPYG
jgi:hypothetical protein